MQSREEIRQAMINKGYKVTNSGEFEHRFVYKNHYGKIPLSWVVHHIDNNRLNNHPDNLIALPRRVHDAIHRLKFIPNRKDIFRIALEMWATHASISNDKKQYGSHVRLFKIQKKKKKKREKKRKRKGKRGGATPLLLDQIEVYKKKILREKKPKVILRKHASFFSSEKFCE